MGNYFKKELKRIVLFGDFGAGKTSIVNRLKHAEFFKGILHTQGINWEKIEYKKAKYSFCDINGQEWCRKQIWPHWYAKNDGVIFVIDSADKDMIEYNAEILKDLLLEKELKNAPFLVMANKQDLNEAISVSEITKIIEKITKSTGKQWHIQGTSAVTGEGIQEGFDWLATSIQSKK